MTECKRCSGAFIVVEEANSTGKSTAMRDPAGRLVDRGVEIVTTREPGDSATAERLRAIILDPTVPMDTIEQLSVFNAARRNHIRTVIQPAMRRGPIVLCDRFVASSLVFQTLHHEGVVRLTDAGILIAQKQCANSSAPPSCSVRNDDR